MPGQDAGYALLSGPADTTVFAPAAWPEDKNGKYRAYYELGEVRSDKTNYWLASALGINGVKLCLRLWVHGSLGGRSKGEIERKVISVTNVAAVKGAGILLDEDNAIYLPFSFDAETLAAEYPAVDKTLPPLDAALDKFLKAHPQIDTAVKDLAAKK